MTTPLLLPRILAHQSRISIKRMHIDNTDVLVKDVRLITVHHTSTHNKILNIPKFLRLPIRQDRSRRKGRKSHRTDHVKLAVVA